MIDLKIQNFRVITMCDEICGGSSARKYFVYTRNNKLKTINQQLIKMRL